MLRYSKDHQSEIVAGKVLPLQFLVQVSRDPISPHREEKGSEKLHDFPGPF